MLDGVRDTCHRWVDVATMVTAIFGVVLYVAEGPSRREAHDTAAWQILALQQDQTGNGGRRWALEVLAADKIDLHGVSLKEADLSGGQGAGVRLDGARLDWSKLWHSNLGGAHLRGAQLRHAALVCTVLSRADLSHADLSGADLSGAEVTAADFTGANLAGARLSEACVSKGGQNPAGLAATRWRECRAWNDAADRTCHQGSQMPEGTWPVATR